MIRQLLFLFLASVLMVSCGTSREAGLGDTVSDGYTKRSKRDVTGSSSTIDRPDVTRTLDIHLSTIAGVTVRGQGPSAEVRIRGGMNSFNLSTEPLFVLDGQVMSGGYASIYASVAVPDIDNINVLKGSEASLYGSRGANGVIVINTKR